LSWATQSFVLSGMNRTDRLVAMVLFLQGRRVVRAAEMAKHFEVTERTIYRDMSALGEAGVPISGEAGVGYCLMKGYQLPPVMFTAEEASAFFVGGELVKQFTDASLQGPMASALDKLRAVLPRDRQDHVEKLVSRTIVRGRVGRAAPDVGTQRWMVTVQQGVVLRRVLRMAYHGLERDEDTQREVEPLGVVFYGGSWYLVAWCRLRKGIRHFRVDRIQRLELLPVTFPAREDFSLAEHMERSGVEGESTPVRIWFHDLARERAQRESYATLSEDRRRDGGAEYTLYSYSLEWTAQWLLSFGERAEAVAPARLRSLVRTAAEKIAAKHG
jgi:predicted DNA-binding transcriptional regulator YafY